jgi:Holliday junction resolvase-like predicted endonuclease
MSYAGKVDIKCRDKDGIVFIEVKYCDVFTFEDLEYSIYLNKRNRIVETSHYFLLKYQQY